ncbi:hypothetical protein Zmor_020974 [Zophobas morio]|uniref:Uncharacterized protein n=1 Tax=Zophobas morio TaxID=2755281 RepID=A0AA38MAL4_9CUCU|nr:hypothetical protein Zmor_020974 [Zophobas morio]
MYAQLPSEYSEGCALSDDARRRAHKYGTEFEYHPEVSRREQHLILIIDFIRKFDQLNASESMPRHRQFIPLRRPQEAFF